MTLEQLNTHTDLLIQLAKAQETRRSFIEAAYPGVSSSTGIPQSHSLKDKVGDLGIEIAEMDCQIDTLQMRIHESEKEVLAFIQSISDTPTRMVFRLRFLHCLTWPEVATVVGGRNTESSVKNICYRYLESCDGL